MSTVGDNILYMRKRLGMTQEELATRMGYKSKSTINKIELGINDIPQSKIVKFAEVLGTTPAYLMGWTEDNNEEKTSPEEPKLSEGAKKWLELYHLLSDETRDVLVNTMTAFDRIPKDKQQFVLQAIRLALGSQE
jgi:transcriptional regulator with XRE-family HTH domain